MFNRISQAEHDKVVNEVKAKQAAQLASLAALVPGTDATDTEAVVAAVTAQLKASNEMRTEIETLGKDVDQAQAVATELKGKLETAEKTVTGIAKFFGAKATAEGFDLVEAVGNIVPESFTATVKEGEGDADDTGKSKLSRVDQIAADLHSGKITTAEFNRQMEAAMLEKKYD